MKYITSLAVTSAIFSFFTAVCMLFVSEAHGDDMGAPIIILMSLIVLCILGIPPAYTIVCLLENFVGKRLHSVLSFVLFLFLFVQMHILAYAVKHPILSRISVVAYFAAPVFLFIAMVRQPGLQTGNQKRDG